MEKVDGIVQVKSWQISSAITTVRSESGKGVVGSDAMVDVAQYTVDTASSSTFIVYVCMQDCSTVMAMHGVASVQFSRHLVTG